MIIEKIVGEGLEHPTAEEVYERTIQVMPTVSMATVYRILNALVAEGRLNKVRVPCGADRFDRILEPHSHICCVDCGRVDNVTALFTPDKDWISDRKGYRVTGCLMTFEGICPLCLEKHKDGTGD